MAARGYTNAERVQLALARPLTADELGRYGFLAEAAEAYIDRRVGNGWLVGPITGERRTIQFGRVRLRHRPIDSVEEVRLGGVFEAPRVLLAATEYVADAELGVLTLPVGLTGEVEADYTPTNAVPAPVAEAATVLVAHWLASGGASASSFKRVSVDGQSWEYRDPAQAGADIPAIVDALLPAAPVLA